MTMSQKIIGSFESVVLPELGNTAVVAKIDTGAYSGAVHCTDIKVIEQDGVEKLQFHPYGMKDVTIEMESFRIRMVRSSTGHKVKRYLIDTSIIINSTVYNTTIGLSDRSDLKFEVLLGRRFLREQNILVDTRINQHLDADIEGVSS